MYVKKGKQIYVEGSVEYSETENEGQKRYWTNINVRDMQMLGSKNDDGWTPEATPQTPPKPQITEPDDDLPF
jgi:single-strand DNA-binding protein